MLIPWLPFSVITPSPLLFKEREKRDEVSI
jgi:hypothetical protein